MTRMAWTAVHGALAGAQSVKDLKPLKGYHGQAVAVHVHPSQIEPHAPLPLRPLEPVLTLAKGN